MKIITKRLALLPCTPEIYARYSKSYPIRGHILSHLDAVKEDSSLIGWGVWFVIHQEDKTVIGDMGFKGKPTKNREVEIGYGIRSSYQNKGYASEAVSALIQWAFASNEVDVITAECLDDNFASIKILEKLNMNKTRRKDGMIYWKRKKD